MYHKNELQKVLTKLLQLKRKAYLELLVNFCFSLVFVINTFSALSRCLDFMKAPATWPVGHFTASVFKAYFARPWGPLVNPSNQPGGQKPGEWSW